MRTSPVYIDSGSALPAGRHSAERIPAAAHSLATNLRSLGVDVKIAQELLRHANSKITLDQHAQEVSSQKREASAKVVEVLLPVGVVTNPQHLSAPSEQQSDPVIDFEGLIGRSRIRISQ